MANDTNNAGRDGGQVQRIYKRLALAPTRISGRFYSVAQAAQLLEVSKQRVLVYLKEERLTGVMVGSVWLIAGCSVERLAELRELSSIGEAFTEGRGPLQLVGQDGEEMEVTG